MTDSRPLRVGIAEDHTLVRHGIEVALKLTGRIEVAWYVARVADVLPAIDRDPPDVLLLDLRMERSALPDVPQLARRVPIVVVTASEHPQEALEAVRAGARAIVLKLHAFETLVEAVEVVAAGGVWLPPEVQRVLATTLQTPPQQRLSAREAEVVRWVALGLRNAEVARKLFVSEATVKTHLHNVFEKLGLRDRVELAMYAAREGMVRPDQVGR